MSPCPAGVKPPFDVYLNAVAKTEGVDYTVADGAVVFPTALVKEGKLGFWRWFMGAFGIGTYRRNDVVDIRYDVRRAAAGRPRPAVRAAGRRRLGRSGQLGLGRRAAAGGERAADVPGAHRPQRPEDRPRRRATG